MATTASGIIDLSIRLSEVWGTGPAAGAWTSDVLGKDKPLHVRMANGTTPPQIDIIYAVKPTIGAGATLSLDLAGSLSDNEGNTITFAEVAGICLVNFDTGDDLTLRQGATNGLASLFTGASEGVYAKSARSSDDPGVALLIAPNGVTVTAGTGDIVEIINGDGSNAANCHLLVWGRSA